MASPVRLSRWAGSVRDGECNQFDVRAGLPLPATITLGIRPGRWPMNSRYRQAFRNASSSMKIPRGNGDFVNPSCLPRTLTDNPITRVVAYNPLAWERSASAGRGFDTFRSGLRPACS